MVRPAKVLRALALALLLPVAAAAQSTGRDMPASLVADSVAITGRNVLVAQGHVEVFHQGRRIRASRITYDADTDRISIEGPILLTDDGGSFILASSADLSADLQDGILRSARLVLNRQLQLASSEVQAIGGRYVSLGRTVASSCRVCNGDSTPLWEIRARRVIHDRQEKQIYFDQAVFRFAGVPVMMIPRLRMPDPSLKRASGFLTTRLRSSSGLGTGLEVPYFIALGQHRDLTLTPFVTDNGAQTLGFRYRQAFATGDLDITGAFSRDNIRPGEQRGYAFLDGTFMLPGDFRLLLRGEAVSDRAYLNDYGITDRDRLQSSIEATRVRRDERIAARLINFHSIRSGDANSRLPSIVGDFVWERRFRPATVGGIATLAFQTHSHFRSSDSGLDSDGDGIGDGRDTARATLRADWRRTTILGPGLLLTGLAEARADIYSISQDDLAQGSFTRASGSVGVELRWPWVRPEARGGAQVIEPVVQVMWSPRRPRPIPNEDSLLSEFDEGNLFSTSRFAGNDQVERGRRINAGMTFTRTSSSGAILSFAAGRIIRGLDETGFSAASGLAGTRSDWLAAVRYNPRPGLSLIGRAIIDDTSDVNKTEVRLDLDRPRYALASSYIWMQADSTEGRQASVSELLLDGHYNLTEAWTMKFATRYDMQADRAASAGVGMVWRNECLKVDLSLSRRFTSSDSVRPRTDFGLSVELLGFGSGSAPGPSRQCRG